MEYRHRYSKTIKILLLAVFIVLTVIISYNLYVSRSIDLEEKQFETPTCIKKSSGFETSGKAPAFLLIHGFSNMPYDMRPVASLLNIMGYASRAIVLPGHISSARYLQQATAEKWIETADREYELLKNRYGSVVIVGFSMGGAIAIDIAGRKDVPGLILISPFFKLKKQWYYFDALEAAADLFKSIVPYVKKTRIGMINDPEKLRVYFAFRHIPLKCISEACKLGRSATQKAKRIKCPVLWMHSKGDAVADFAASRKVFESLPLTNKYFIEFNKSNHTILYDYDSEAAIAKIAEFIELSFGTKAQSFLAHLISG